MVLSSDLVSMFAKVTKPENETKKESIVYGTAVIVDGRTYVRIDGSDRLTPVSTTADTKDGERVTVMIKDHTATATGNMSSPAARTHDVQEIGGKISEFEVIMADSVTTTDLEAINATIESLRAVTADIDGLTVDELDAINAEIDTLQAKYADIEYVSAHTMTAFSADIENLRGKYASFESVSTDDLTAVNAEIDNLVGHFAAFDYVSADTLKAIKAEIEGLDSEYAEIDFANIGEAAIKKIFAESGLIKDIIVGDGTITGHLVGVTISGDLIEGNTIKAEKLLIKGEDGLYYQMNVENGIVSSEEVSVEDLQNGLHGSVIIAKSITAEQIAVKDLVAFGATIGGFIITDNSIHSVLKDSVSNISPGFYVDNDGQMAVGDQDRYLKYYYDEEENVYKLAIQADQILLGASDVKMDLEDQIQMTFEKTVTDRSEIDNEFAKYAKYIQFSENGIIIGDKEENKITLQIDNNDGIIFRRGEDIIGKWTGEYFETGNIYIKTDEQARFGNFAFIPRSDGSLSFLKVGD